MKKIVISVPVEINGEMVQPETVLELDDSQAILLVKFGHAKYIDEPDQPVAISEQKSKVTRKKEA